MNKTIKKKWVAALRSGDYAQGRQVLHVIGKGKTKDKFCCLGVLYETLGKSVTKGFVKGENWVRYNGSVYQLDFVTRTALEITGGQQAELIEMNDRGTSFSDIADWIEKNL